MRALMQFPLWPALSLRRQAPALRVHVNAPRAAFTSASSVFSRSSDNGFPARGNAAANTHQPHATLHQKKSFILPMFPYPSGSLHMGHVRVYTISDVLARFHRMKGFNVLHPMGWDAFGLPAENAAIERGIDPAAWTAQNIAKMKQQLIGMGVDFDWDREFMTCSPSFYKHTQKLFLMLLSRGLAYQADAMVNWDPVDKTVLANEQVDSDGRSWRSGAVVEKVQLKQWFFRITNYQNALLHDLDILSEHKRWPERVLTQQRNWLGRSTGAKIRFAVRQGDTPSGEVDVYTTRPDTLFGVKYLALSTTHPFVQDQAQRLPSLQAFLKRAPALPPDSKEGYLLPEVLASNPLNHIVPDGIQDKQIPIYVAPYVVGGYGEGAVMGVPGHDSTDLDFWRHQDSSNMVSLVINDFRSPYEPQANFCVCEVTGPFTSHGVLNSGCGKYAGLRSSEGGKQITEDLARRGQHASFTEHWRLRDWLISRQRYWGTPIPIVHCVKCGAVPVPDDQLPVELPMLDESIKGKTGNSLQKVTSWVNTTCPGCGQPAQRETDTMDTFVDSSWYFMRFPDAKNHKDLVSKEAAAASLPVDIYVGGVEHAILHLLYARFIYKFLADEGLLSGHESPGKSLAEPYRRLISQGMVHGKTFSDPATGQFLHPAEVEGADTPTPIIKASGHMAAVSFEKMSKSKHNGVDPSECIAKYGVDATRAHMLFSAPVSEKLEWDEGKIVGIQRWFGRVSRIVDVCCKSESTPTASDIGLLSQLILAEESPLSAETAENALTARLHAPDDLETLLFVTKSISSINNTFSNNIYALNTAISTLIKLTNKILSSTISTSPDLTLWSTCVLLRMLAPVAPTFAQESWQALQKLPNILDICDSHWPGCNESIFRAPFPNPPLTPQASTLLSQHRPTIQCAVQINGKLRFSVLLPAATASSAEARLKSNKDTDGSVQQQQQQDEDEDEDEEQEQLIEHLLQTSDGQAWLTHKNDWGSRKRVIVVKRPDGTRIVNVVFPK